MPKIPKKCKKWKRNGKDFVVSKKKREQKRESILDKNTFIQKTFYPYVVRRYVVTSNTCVGEQTLP